MEVGTRVTEGGAGGAGGMGGGVYSKQTKSYLVQTFGSETGSPFKKRVIRRFTHPH